MRVLISGAGIAGPALAWHLAKAGARVTVVEKAQSLLSHGQNIDVNGSALTVIKKMGLLDELRRYNTTEKGTQLIDPQGRPFAPFPVKRGSSASPTSEFEILRGDLAIVLHEATKDHPNVTYRFGTTVSRVVSNDAAAVTVELSDGSTRSFALLVAADGQRSRLRGQCFPADAVAAVDKGMYATYWTVPRRASDNDWWNVYFALGRRVLSVRPDPHGTMRACFTRMPRDAAERAAWRAASEGGRRAQEALVRREFADAGWSQAPRLLAGMAAAPDFYFQAVRQVRLARWSAGRVVCLGDAAYAPTPLTGAGASLAILGAYVLAGELSRLGPGEEHPARALDAFEKAFRPWVEETQKIPSIVPGVAHPETAWQRWLLQSFLALLSRAVAIPWLVRRFDRDTSEEDFPLPRYPVFDDESSKAAAS